MRNFTSRLGVSLSQTVNSRLDVNAEDQVLVDSEVLLVHDSYLSERGADPSCALASRPVRRYPRKCAINWAKQANNSIISHFPSTSSSKHSGPIESGLAGNMAPLVNLTQVPSARRLFLAPHNELSLNYAKNCGHKLRRWFTTERRIVRDGQVCNVIDVYEHALRIGERMPNQSVRFTIAAVSPFQQSIVDENTTFCILWDSCGGNELSSDNNAFSWSTVEQENDGDTVVLDESYLASVVLHTESTGDATTEVDKPPVVGRCTMPPPGPPLSDVCCSADLTLLVSAKDLNIGGIFDNQWALASTNGHLRTVRVKLWSGASDGGVFGAQPLLLYNLDHSPQSNKRVRLQASSVGQDVFPFPPAQLVTLALVASPQSEQSWFRAILLHNLKKIQHSTSLVLKCGDLLRVELTPDDARVLASYISPNQGAEEELLEDLKLERMLTTFDNGMEPSHVAAAMSELGSHVHPVKTQLSQLGSERSYIPVCDNDCSRSGIALVQALIEMVQPFLRSGTHNILLTPSFVVRGARGVGKRHAVQTVAKNLGLHFHEIDCYSLLDDTLVKAQRRLKIGVDRASRCGPCVLFFHHVDSLLQTRSVIIDDIAGTALVDTLRHSLDTLNGVEGSGGYPILVVASSTSEEPLPAKLAEIFKLKLTVDAPDEAERRSILIELFSDADPPTQTLLQSLVRDTAALAAIDLQQLIFESKFLALERCLALFGPHFSLAGIVIEQSDFALAVSVTRRSSAQVIGAPTIPAVSWDDVGGLRVVKDDILDTILLPLENPELFSEGMKKRSGILLHGPPGTGKTMLAKAVATSCSLNFLSVKGPELLNMYIGESEANVRRIFHKAREAMPCIIFFDELDSIAPARGKQGDSGGVMDRIVSQLLSELDGLAGGQGAADIFVIGATNRPDLLDPALLRPGRFDRLLYLGVSETHEDQANIIKALTRKFMTSPDFNASDIAKHCPFHYTGADFYALCSDALLEAMTRKAREVEYKLDQLQDTHPRRQRLTPQAFLAKYDVPLDSKVIVTASDFEVARSRIVPSVSSEEMDHYRQAQERFAKATVLAP